MGTLRINGINILNYTTPISTSIVGNKHAAFPDKIRGLTTAVDDNTQKIVKGWNLSNNNSFSSNSNYDALQGKLKVNGVVAPVMIDGTRPRNIEEKVSITGCGLTYYLNNVNGSLYLSLNPNEASGTFIITSKAINKDVVVNIACWGAGGKGGGGAYWFLKGNWGGTGGSSGGKIFGTLCIKNNENYKIVTSDEESFEGRLSNSSDTTYQAPGLYIYNNNNQQIISCTGGYSGVNSHPRWKDDVLTECGSASSTSTNNLPFIRRKIASELGIKTGNGLPGTSVTFSNSYSPYLGNPEGNQGSLVLTGEGGISPGTTYVQSRGSGGAGGYGDGGASGDTGTGSSGSPGVNGGGGGGGGSPAGGCAGGEGGLPGFIIFY